MRALPFLIPISMNVYPHSRCSINPTVLPTAGFGSSTAEAEAEKDREGNNNKHAIATFPTMAKKLDSFLNATSSVCE